MTCCYHKLLGMPKSRVALQTTDFLNISGVESTVSLKHIAFYVCVIACYDAFPLLAWSSMVTLFLQAGLMHHGSLFEFACAHACA